MTGIVRPSVRLWLGPPAFFTRAYLVSAKAELQPDRPTDRPHNRNEPVAPPYVQHGPGNNNQVLLAKLELYRAANLEHRVF